MNITPKLQMFPLKFSALKVLLEKIKKISSDSGCLIYGNILNIFFST